MSEGNVLSIESILRAKQALESVELDHNIEDHEFIGSGLMVKELLKDARVTQCGLELEDNSLYLVSCKGITKLQDQ